MKDIEQIRKTLHKLKPKKIDDLKSDYSDLDDILDEYDKISTVAKDLIKLSGKNLSEVLATQASEYYFFKGCSVSLKGILEFMEAYLRHARGQFYENIRRTESRDLNDRAINSIIDSKPEILDITFQLLRVKEMYERYYTIVESYQHRGYCLNNITKSLEASAIDYLIQ